MACHHPLQAWRGIKDGKINLTLPIPKTVPQERRLQLPCTKCLGCRKDVAKGWALRCRLELQQHPFATFATLTYSPEHLPQWGRLEKRDLQLFLKRLRINAERSLAIKSLRFFACGEYGTTGGRPHYHAILFGLHHTDHRELIEHSWALGQTQTREANGRRIAYTAGYVAKKWNEPHAENHERVDLETGEVYTWQKPFIQMSRGGRRGHGIGGHARQWPESWRDYAITDGYKHKVPRYLHEAWKKQATEEEKQQLLEKKAALALRRDTSTDRLRAAEKILKRQQQLREQSRKLA